MRAPGPIQYKVVELSTVDERSLERTVNEWSAKGWTLDGVQFAMRESSKRPSMAFVFFTREGVAVEQELEQGTDDARERLMRLSETGSPTVELMEEHARVHAERLGQRTYPTSAHERLAQLAGVDEAESPEVGLTLELEEGPPLELETLQEGVTFEPGAPEVGLTLDLDEEPDESEEPQR